MTSKERPAPKRQRIAKLIARAGLCSRRDAEAWIVEGRVSVNGTVLTSPAVDVSEDDRILVDEVPLPAVEKTRLFLFHKPRGLVTSDHDPEGRATVADYLREHWPEGPRVVTIGRLDINTEGLLLLTNDGGLARTLELPQTGWVRRYRVRAKGTADVASLDALADGITIDGIDYAGIEAKLDRTQGANCWLTMGLREGKNREIKRVLEHLGLEVNRLIRLSFGPFQLLDLEEGAVEEVRTRVLRDQLGEKLASQAGVDLEGPPPAPSPERRVAPREQTEGRPRPQKSPERRGRSDAPPRRGRDPREDTPPPKRERPLAGTRKHVSTLRAAEDEAARRGPRRRIERTDTQDRNERTVRVERLVSTRPAAPERPRRPERRTDEERAAPRRGAARGGNEERPGRAARPARAEGDGPRRQRDDRPAGTGRREGSRPGGERKGPRGPRREGSPSAQGKRERMARSGGGAEGERRAPRESRHGERAASRDGKPTRDRPTRAPRAAAEGGRERRDEGPRGKRSEGKRTRSEDGRDRRPAGKPSAGPRKAGAAGKGRPGGPKRAGPPGKGGANRGGAGRGGPGKSGPGKGGAGARPRGAPPKR